MQNESRVIFEFQFKDKDICKKLLLQFIKKDIEKVTLC